MQQMTVACSAPGHPSITQLKHSRLESIKEEGTEILQKPEEQKVSSDTVTCIYDREGTPVKS